MKKYDQLSRIHSEVNKQTTKQETTKHFANQKGYSQSVHKGHFRKFNIKYQSG